MSSRKIFAANWKLHKNPTQTREFLKAFLPKAQKIPHDFFIFPPATSLEACSEILKGTGILFGSQNCCAQVQGAFTGEVSAQVVKDLQGEVVLLGHSERRKIFSETDEIISQKMKLVQSLGLRAVFCIGETLEEREEGVTQKVLKSQIQKGLKEFSVSKSNAENKLIVAYEPVWAIGTGKIASSEQVRETHRWVKEILEAEGFSQVPVLYGGSVKPDNSRELLGIPGVDGFLVGGASLEVDSFLQIAAGA